MERITQYRINFLNYMDDLVENKIPEIVADINDPSDIGKIELLEDIIDDIYTIRQQYFDNCGVLMVISPKLIGDDVISNIRNIIRNAEIKCGDIYNLDQNLISMFDSEKVNGYYLYNVCKTNMVMTRERYNQLSELYDDNSMTDIEFKEWFTKSACTDWYKQQPDGTCFGGFWDYPKESEEYNDAFLLTGQHNVDELLKLPFSRKLLCETIRIGCGNRHESVRYSNFICEWVKRKKMLLKISDKNKNGKYLCS
jgi:hypothetical protein